MAAEQFDTAWRVISCWSSLSDDDEFCEVECFDAYGPAFAAWSALDAGKLTMAGFRLSSYELLDPNGLVLLDQESAPFEGLIPASDPGRYRYVDDASGFVLMA